MKIHENTNDSIGGGHVCFLHLESEPEGRTLIPVQSQCPNNNSPERHQTKVKMTDREDQFAMATFFPAFSHPTSVLLADPSFFYLTCMSEIVGLQLVSEFLNHQHWSGHRRQDGYTP